MTAAETMPVYVIEDFTFSGFCILGDSVEPCFENADIASYSLNKEEFISTGKKGLK